MRVTDREHRSTAVPRSLLAASLPLDDWQRDDDDDPFDVRGFVSVSCVAKASRRDNAVLLLLLPSCAHFAFIKIQVQSLSHLKSIMEKLFSSASLVVI